MTFNFIRNKESKYGEGLLIDEYNGKISIVNAHEGEGGKIWKDWACPIHKKQPKLKDDGSPVMLPSGIRLGDPKTAIATLKKMILMIETETGVADDPQTDDSDVDDSIPF
jgi:hypothetical protein